MASENRLPIKADIDEDFVCSCGCCGDPGDLCGSECQRTSLTCKYPTIWEATKAAIRAGETATNYRFMTPAEVLAKMEAIE